MRIRWSTPAAQDLFRIIEYIRAENAPASLRVATAIYESVGSLQSFPYLGRQGRVEGTRELPVPSLPFLVVYRVTPEYIEIAGIIHGATLASRGLKPSSWADGIARSPGAEAQIDVNL